MKLPSVTQQPILHIDGTPDKGYVLRILRAYRGDCNCRWADTTEGTGIENPILKLMNEDCEKRAKLLDEAIKILGQNDR